MINNYTTNWGIITGLALMISVSNAADTAAFEMINFGCFNVKDDFASVTFLKKRPQKSTCSFAYPIIGFGYKTAKGTVRGYSARLNSDATDFELGQPGSYMLGANRLVRFDKCITIDGVKRCLVWDRDTFSASWLKDPGRNGATFAFDYRKRIAGHVKKPMLTIAYGKRAYTRLGSDKLKPGSIDMDWCGEWVAKVDKKNCGLPIKSISGDYCFKIKNLGAAQNISKGISNLDSDLLRDLRPFDLVKGKKYPVAMKVNPKQYLGDSGLLSDDQIRSAGGSVYNDLLAFKKGREVRISASTFVWNNGIRSLFSYTSRHTIIVQEYRLSNNSKLHTFFVIFDKEQNDIVGIEVSEPNQKLLIVNSKQYIRFMKKLLKAGFEEVLANGITNQLSTLK